MAAALLLEQGYNVYGLTMVTGPPAGPDCQPAAAGRGDAGEAIAAARAVCHKLGVRHLAVDLREEFGDRVVRPFVDAYAAGLTPNPCLLCNAAIKFGLLMESALAHGAELFATGHYAALEQVDPADLGLEAACRGRAATDRAGRRIFLLRRTGAVKDQTYALCLLTQEQLRRCHFPLHGLTKAGVRASARRYGLDALVLPESQDVCFLRGRDYREFVSRSLRTAAGRPADEPGPIVDSSGRVLGLHRGLLAYTVGQRRGLGLGGPQVRYVLELRPETNELVVGTEDELLCSSLVADGPVFAAFDRLLCQISVSAAIRYRSRPSPAEVSPTGEDRLSVTFRIPQRAVAPGQAVAFYVGDWLIGGARIAGRP